MIKTSFAQKPKEGTGNLGSLSGVQEPALSLPQGGVPL